MKITEITESITDVSIIKKLLIESLDRPFPYTKISPSTWEIDVPNKGKLIVSIDQRAINGYDMAHISFNVPNPTGGQPQLTNWFSGTGATGVFAAVIEIAKKYSGIDLMIFVPSDAIVSIQNRKARLYMMMLNRMKTENYLVRIEEFKQLTGEVYQVGFPSGSKLWNTPSDDVQALLIDYLIDKSV